MADTYNALYGPELGYPGDAGYFRTPMRQPNALMGPVWENSHAAPQQAPHRPADWAVTSGVAETISPTMGAYGMGNALGTTYQATRAGDYGNALEAGLPIAAMGFMPGPKGAKPRAVDSLGYYSGALEAANGLKQAKGTPEQMLSQLRAGGTKAGEIEATGLSKFLEGRPSVTRDEIVSHLEGNRLGLKEVSYLHEGRDIGERLYDINNEMRGLPADHPARAGLMQEARDLQAASERKAKWSAHSLDPSNATYRETVLHLPESAAERADKLAAAGAQIEADAARAGFTDWRAVDGLARARRGEASADTVFRSGHFPEPNIVGHMMTSMTRHEGKPVYTIDQIQSDWGQKLRDGGVRDEAKIAELKQGYEAAQKRADEIAEKFMADLPDGDRSKNYKGDAMDRLSQMRALGDPVGMEWAKHWGDARRLSAEYKTANESASGHPLVNTTDQWTNTTLRRAIQQAIEAKASGIAVPTGDTVLSYNPGDTAGMRGFYGSQEQRGIVPKNLANILQKLDPSIKGQYVNQLMTPGNGMAGSGFTYFPLSETAIAKAREGMPLFSMLPAAMMAGGVGVNALYGSENQ